MIPVPTPGNDPGSGGGQAGGSSSGTEAANISGKNLREGNNISLRPNVITSAHLYNLRNQTWAIPKVSWGGSATSKTDTISAFHGSASKYPSNSDSINAFIYANTASSNNKDVERFNVEDAVGNPLGSSIAPQGYFIIDAMERGISRLQVVGELEDQYSLSLTVNNLPQDITPGGPTAITEYAGRLFYSGFSGDIIDGDVNSPKMSSYILFSQLVQDISDINSCYQEADPTNKDDPDLVDTDGGFIRIEGAFGITNLTHLGNSLFVLAKNGVWQVSGGNDYGFKATDYKTTNLSNHGCVAVGSVITVDSSMFYWGQDGIYTISPNQFGDYVVENITKNNIQTLYDEINPLDLAQAKGVYDSYEKKIKWIYSSRDASTGLTKELILDLNTGAFTLFEISQLGDTKYPMVVEGVQTNPYSLFSDVEDVVAGTEVVQVGGVGVVVNVESTISSSVEVKYLCITSITGGVKISFGSYDQADHYDWKSYDGVGVDAPSYMLTGKMTGGDMQHKKSAPYITFHFLKTEDGFTEDNDGDFIPTNQSSAKVQAQWGWTNSVNSNKWGREFQAYRFRRHWMPSNISDSFDNGYYITDHKTKLRGNGPSLSLLIKSEPGKHLSLYGWSMIMDATENV